MKFPRAARTLLAAVALMTGMIDLSLAQTPASMPSADPWPRQTQLSNASVLVYQPQVEAWDGNLLQMRAAIAIKPSGSGAQTYGSVFATVRTQVDRAARTVVLSNLTITKKNFPTLGDKADAYVAELTTKLAASMRTISLDRVEASLKAAGVKPPSFPVMNDPPRIIVSTAPAILVPIDGKPVMKPVPDDSRFKRVINTQALILQGGLGDEFFVHVYDGWMSAKSLDGPWAVAAWAPVGMDGLAKKLAAAGTVDLLDGGPNANPKPLLAKGAPTLYTSQVPTELVVFRGKPDFVPVPDTGLLWATNTGSYVIVDTASNNFYLLLAGRWFVGAGINGPWSFVAGNALPASFAKIPTSSPAGVVLASVAGTPQAQEAVIANSVPQTATVPRANGPKFTPTFDGAPQFQPIEGTTLSYTVNAPVPVIRVDANSYVAVASGVWYAAPAVNGPWSVAVSVPPQIYTIPTSSPLHYVTYVRIYDSTPDVVYVGYTPGYMGTVVEPYGTVVYGTGYAYSPWIGGVWYGPPYTYGVAAVPVYNPALGFSYGFAVGLATAAWVTPYYGAAYHPYACCGSVSASVYGQYGNKAYAGTRTAYASSTGAVGVASSGSYVNKATGTTGNYATNRSYNPYTGVAKEGGAATANTVKGGSATVAAGQSYNAYTGQRTAGSSVSATGAGGSSVEHTGATTAGPQGVAHTGQTTVTNANTGQTKSTSSGAPANDHYADANGNVMKGSASTGWQQHSAGGWQSSSADMSAMNRESEARSFGQQRTSAFSGGGFGGGGFRGGGGRR